MAVTFSSDGRELLTTGQDQSLRLWDAGTGLQMRVFEADRQDFLSADLSSDSKLVAAVGTGNAASAFIWDAATEKIVEIIRDESGLDAALFRPGERTLVTTARNGSSRLWALPASVQSPSEIASWVACHVHFRLDGARLIRATPNAANCPH